MGWNILYPCAHPHQCPESARSGLAEKKKKTKKKKKKGKKTRRSFFGLPYSQTILILSLILILIFILSELLLARACLLNLTLADSTLDTRHLTLCSTCSSYLLPYAASVSEPDCSRCRCPRPLLDVLASYCCFFARLDDYNEVPSTYRMLCVEPNSCVRRRRRCILLVHTKIKFRPSRALWLGSQ